LISYQYQKKTVVRLGRSMADWKKWKYTRETREGMEVRDTSSYWKRRKRCFRGGDGTGGGDGGRIASKTGAADSATCYDHSHT
jgi:hypothetical protein